MKHAGEDRLPTEQNKRLSHPSIEEVGTLGNLAADDELYAQLEQEPLARTLFQLALALATEPSNRGQLRQVVHLQEQRAIALDFSTWAIGHIDARVKSMALEYAHDAEVLVQTLSFKGGTFVSLMQAIEDLYLHEQITQRVYIKAKLLLWTNVPPKPERQVS